MTLLKEKVLNFRGNVMTKLSQSKLRKKCNEHDLYCIYAVIYLNYPDFYIIRYNRKL